MAEFLEDIPNYFDEITQSSGNTSSNFCSEQTFVNKEENVDHLKRRVQELEELVNNLKISHHLNNPRPLEEQKVRITDFSPEWDFTPGGQKMILTFTSDSIIDVTQCSNLQIFFGDTPTKAHLIQSGVLKCLGKRRLFSKIFYLKLIFFFFYSCSSASRGGNSENLSARRGTQNR